MVPVNKWTYNTASGIFEPTICSHVGGKEKTLVFDISHVVPEVNDDVTATA